MTGMDRHNRDAFDFSQDAQDFKARLWGKLKTKMVMTSAQELEDDNLEWVNAAGMPVHPDDRDKRV